MQAGNSQQSLSQYSPCCPTLQNASDLALGISANDLQMGYLTLKVQGSNRNLKHVSLQEGTLIAKAFNQVFTKSHLSAKVFNISSTPSSFPEASSYASCAAPMPNSNVAFYPQPPQA